MANASNRVAIVSAVRTPIGAFGGALCDVPAAVLGEVVLRAVLERGGVAGSDVDEVILGNVLQAGTGSNPARIAAVSAGIPYETPAMTLNKVCGSGLKAIELGAQAIRCGGAAVVAAGGMESMSTAPFLLQKARWGQRLGHGELLDSMIVDGLWDRFYDCHMGVTAENLAEQYGISRQAQDEYALQSQRRCAAARADGRFAAELVSVPVPQRKGDPIAFETDEHPRENLTLADLERLKPAFKKDGTVTPGNASGINDGAAGVVLMTEEHAERRGVAPLAFIRGTAAVGVDPRIMGIGPVGAIRKLVKQTDLSLDDIDLLEVNEAFAAQILAVEQELKWDRERVNVNGGAVALGHPLGASGARILVTLIHEMQRRGARLGIAALCIGGGMGIAMLVEQGAAQRKSVTF